MNPSDILKQRLIYRLQKYMEIEPERKISNRKIKRKCSHCQCYPRNNE